MLLFGGIPPPSGGIFNLTSGARWISVAVPTLVDTADDFLLQSIFVLSADLGERG